jgi:hypothetical protein
MFLEPIADANKGNLEKQNNEAKINDIPRIE